MLKGLSGGTKLRPAVAGILLSGALGILLAGEEPRRSAPPTARPRPVLSGRARADLIVDRDRNSPNFVVPVRVDLGSVALDGELLVLGAYIARIDFDPAAVSYLGTEGGEEPRFATAPFATDPAIANAQGFVKLTAVQLDEIGPVGLVSVARARFRELQPMGSQTITLRLESVASALRRNDDGVAAPSLEVPIERTPENP